MRVSHNNETTCKWGSATLELIMLFAFWLVLSGRFQVKYMRGIPFAGLGTTGCVGMKMIRWKRIIKRMLELAKRWGPYFFSAFVALVIGIVPALILLNNPAPLVTMLAVLAVICLIATIIALYYDIKGARKKDYEEKHPPPFKLW